MTPGSCWAKSPAPSSPLCHWRAWFTSGTLSRGRWLSRHGAGCLSCQLTLIWLVAPSHGSVLRSHGRAMSCQISSTQVVDPNRSSVIQSHSKVMHGPCRPPQQVSAYAPPPHFFEPTKQLTAPADRPVRDPARAVAFTTAVANRAIGSVHRRTGMRTARALAGDRNRPGSPPATDCRQNPPPALPAGQTRCFANHDPAWRCAAGPGRRPPEGPRSCWPIPSFRQESAAIDRLLAVGICLMGRTRGSHLPSNAALRQAASVRHLSGHPVVQERGCKMILKEPYARAA